eukprot:8821087-Pyramimonas_sp.AAC.1
MHEHPEVLDDCGVQPAQLGVLDEVKLHAAARGAHYAVDEDDALEPPWGTPVPELAHDSPG